MSDNICNICNRDISSLGEDGCPDCGLEYDPMAPDIHEPLDFDKDPCTDKYGDIPLTAPWDADGE